MPKNIEIKARVSDFAALNARAAELGDGPVLELRQVDTFFHTAQGRLKLRVESAGRGQLIYYLRPDETGPKASYYEIYPTRDPAALKAILSTSFGVRGEVRKIRRLYRVGQTRIHLDQVEGLGDFMELEVVLAPGQNESEGEVIAHNLLAGLGIEPAALVRGAYLDLLETRH
jgi:predicted adenylyl cyclase CyaB